MHDLPKNISTASWRRRFRKCERARRLLFTLENETGIWVTTQLVEASLDIDFDVLYTEMSTADSLLQRMGRCNRKGRYIPDKANIHIYINANGVGVSRAIYNREIYTRSFILAEL